MSDQSTQPEQASPRDHVCCGCQMEEFMASVSADVKDKTGDEAKLLTGEFEKWWASKVAQGYQYGREPLCNVRFGFEAGFHAATNAHEQLLTEVKRLREALESIANHPHQSYEVSTVEVADGHRCAANIARSALASGVEEK